MSKQSNKQASKLYYCDVPIHKQLWCTIIWLIRPSPMGLQVTFGYISLQNSVMSDIHTLLSYKQSVPPFIHTVHYKFSKLFWGAFTDHFKGISLWGNINVHVLVRSPLSRRACTKNLSVFVVCITPKITHVSHLQYRHLYILDTNVLM